MLKSGKGTGEPRTEGDGATADGGRVYGGVSQAQRSDERRRRFLDAGIALFGTVGYERTTTRSLCAEAGLTQRYFYEAFSGVEALFSAVATELGARMKADLVQAVAAARSTDATVLARAALEAYFRMMRDDRRAARILLTEVYTATAQTVQEARAYVADIADFLHRTALQLNPHAASAGFDLKLVSVGLVGAGHHIALQWIENDCRTPLKRVVDSTLRLYEAAIPAAAP